MGFCLVHGKGRLLAQHVWRCQTVKGGAEADVCRC